MTDTSRPTLDQRPAETATKVLSARKLAVLAIFIALSAVGSLIKIPSPVGTIGMDSAPGYFVALGFGGAMGAIVISIGHLLTAALVGFPLSLPVHLVIAAGMAVCAYVLALIGRRSTVGLIVGFCLAAVLNSFALGLVVVPAGGWALYVATIPMLLVGAILNLAIATIGYLALRNTRLLS